MDWLLEKLFDLARESQNILWISYSIYGIILFIFYSVFIKENIPWQEYLRISRWRLLIFIMVLLPFITITLFFEFPLCIQRQKLMVIGGTIAVEIILLIYLWKCPSKEKRKMDKIYEEELSPVKRYLKLSEIKEGTLTPKEKKVLKQRKYFTLYELGCLKQAEILMKNVEEKNGSRYLMIQSIIAENNGNIEDAFKLMEQACNQCSANSEEHYLQIQLWNNMGRAYRIAGNFREALVYYKQAVDGLIFPKEEKIAKEIYTNYIFTLSMLKTPWDTIEKVIKEYESHLDMTKIENYILGMNMRIVAAKQSGVEEVWKKEILQGFKEVMKKQLTQEQRLIFEATSLRLAHTSGVNFIEPLNAIKKDILLFRSLEMPTRYFMIKEIHILFQLQSGVPLSVLELYSDVGDVVTKYMAEQAQEDIEEYLISLPTEAVLERGKMQTELASIQRYQKEYSFEKCKEILLSVRNLYETNGLMLEAVRITINLADEHFMIRNLNDELMPVHAKSLKEAMNYADGYLSTVQLHPGFADMFMQLAWMYIRLHEYEKSVKYMDLYSACNIADEHYVTWFKSQMGAVRFIKDVLSIRGALEEIKKDPNQLQSVSKEARQWLLRYPKEISSLEISLLWGGLLGFERVYVKRKNWVAKNLKGICTKEHYWLCVNEPVDEEKRLYNTIFELDMAYDNLQESDISKMLFIPQMHPFETGKSLTLRRDLEETRMRMPYVENQIYPFPHVDKHGKRTVLEEICKYVLERRFEL